SELEKQAGDIFRPNGRTQPVYFLLQELDEIDRQLREQDDDSETWSKLQSDLAAFTRESKELREAQRRSQAERAQIDVVLDASKALQHAREQFAAHEASVPAGNDDGERERVSLL